MSVIEESGRRTVKKKQKKSTKMWNEYIEIYH